MLGFCASKASRAVIFVYQAAVSPLLGQGCRFVPSCSEFASEAVEKYGFLRGWWYAFKRLLRCHPFDRGGYDPVR